jgi:ArsR family transcriptional regulator, arsenate/arsenite/antimonite-responsive transcriptional repressor
VMAPCTLDSRRYFLYRRNTMNGSETEDLCPPPRPLSDAAPVDGPEADVELAQLAKALGHPARVQILRILIRSTACLGGEIAREVPLAQSTVSQHLKVLKEAGIIRGEVDGPRVCYCLEPAAITRLKALVNALGYGVVSSVRSDSLCIPTREGERRR